MSRARSLAQQQQLRLPALDEPQEVADLPEPTPAVACPRCGWLVLQSEAACPLCHAPKDSPP
ncbi:hypothetical protein [Nannocystis punicea]|uniref:Small CPxCG-related zinc finger protein n=1 Tax=Nannocystis punicea TaxID=2995304 RepID=A0ABY7HH88_9BACT|nr:hypothetical protein [Nannocystis poenicansa]WAS98244.1 hypothetical protein O0S08_19050 [Nannocystis poenicansa]